MVRLSGRMGTLACAALLFSLASRANAQEPPPPAPAAAAAERPLFGGAHLGVAANFSTTSPNVVLAGFVDNFLYAAGLGVDFTNHNAALATPGMSPPSSTSFNLVFSAAYMLHNKFPFAMGPEFDWVPFLSLPGDSTAFKFHVLQLGWAFWYAPFPIPAVVGTGVFLEIDINAIPADTVITITTPTPGVRVVFGFN